VELIAGATATADELKAFAQDHVGERAAIPKHVEIMGELPKSAVGKVLKNELRKLAIRRVYGAALTKAGVGAEVTDVYESKKRGLVARLKRTSPDVTDDQVAHCLGSFIRPWEWADQAN